ncbi:M14 family metallopeptidase [Shewanella sp. C32]|uniref:M14 family metallopeptidase n=1 Tax=Shewanella electrica TaxID=515560 RepID=A0ABT2FMH1_9GAMM|nr:M14 family metallopeptidase [Shewanella electrica]MCH1926106.1 M14 family metallopeptidase [Shewanella electrica]MCS4557525.1 M14 family metallopeptidase [Shewanella electrica]
MPIKTTLLASSIIAILSLSTASAMAAPLQATTSADSSSELWPNAQYAANIPTIKQVLGYHLGERITTHSDMLRYFEALAKAAPDRIKLFDYGTTWEGRQLIYAAIAKPDTLAHLDQFSADMQQLADPRKTNKQQAQKLIKQLPSSVWLEHSVHGNEISSTDAAMMTAYHLLATQNDAMVDKIFANTVVFIDPLQNPDGRMRFINFYYQTVGLQPSSDRLSVEHNEPWPRGRSNHYLFDMNRDWLTITQPETAGRIKALLKYKPNIVVDLHEMQGDASYFFVPAADPINPHMSKTQIANNTLVGKNNAKYFDEFGFDYYTREVFDGFYPGYGDSWPTFYGASAATYEVASARGDHFKKTNGDILTFIDTVQKHFVASLATAETAADHREKLLTDFYQYQVDAIKAGKDDDERSFILPASDDLAGSHKLATLMAKHGVEVRQADKAFSACGKDYSAGAYVIDTAQPRGRFVKTLFTQQVDMDKPFLTEQERRRARKLHDEIYDVTAWSLPLMYNVDSYSCDDAIDVASHSVSADAPLQGKVVNPNAKVAYLVPWGDMASGRFLTAALRQGIRVKSADKAFTTGDNHNYPAGSLIVEVKANDADLAAQVQQIANDTGAQVTGVDSSWVIKGPNFGSENTVTMSAPNVAMAWDEPTSSLNAGNTRYVIEQQFNWPVTAIRSAQLASANLSDYQVLILPSGDYSQALGESGAANLKNWVKQGGVLITLDDATRYASTPKAGLIDVQQELAYRAESKDGAPSDKADKSDSSDDNRVAGSLIKSHDELISRIETPQELPDHVSGVLANVEVDQEHWLTAGVKPEVVSLVIGNDMFTPIKLASGKNVAWFSDEKHLLASGYMWQQNRKQLAYKPFLIYQPTGNGMVIGYTQDPTARGYLDGLNVMLMNTIFRAAAHATPLR